MYYMCIHCEFNENLMFYNTTYVSLTGDRLTDSHIQILEMVSHLKRVQHRSKRKGLIPNGAGLEGGGGLIQPTPSIDHQVSL